jgi:hypothetical protein
MVICAMLLGRHRFQAHRDQANAYGESADVGERLISGELLPLTWTMLDDVKEAI